MTIDERQPETTPASDWDPIGPDNIADPVSVHRQMRGECPVAYSEQFGGFWSVFDYADIVRVARETDDFISAPQFMVPNLDVGGVPWVPLQADPPMHRQYRKIINPFFVASRLESFEPRLRQVTNELIDTFAARGHADLATELNIPLPATAICLLLGLPDTAWIKFHEWTIGIVAAGNRGDHQALADVFDDLFAFAREWMGQRRAEPSDDVMSAMLAAEVDGRPLTEQEIFGMFVLLASAGHETTSNALSSAMHYLATHPEDRRRLREEPELMPTAVEEFIRVFAPVQGQGRTTAKDVTIGDRTLPSNQPIMLMFASGSRDEKKFERPDECIIDRNDKSHVSFGIGIHRCMGEHLARLEMRVVLETLLQRIPDFEIDGPTEGAMWPAIGFHKLPVRFDPVELA